MKFAKEVLEEHKLSREEMKSLDSKIAATIKKISAELKRKKLKADVVEGGSAAKGVLLKGDFDVDLFVRFDQKYRNSDISDLLAAALKPFKPVRLQGSRDYFQFIRECVHFEIVPVLRIKGWREAVNVTDASPLHVTWVNGKIRKKPKLRDEIILTKVFLKANRLYGAESYIGGFSGHVVDILVINYGSFMGLLKAASVWKPYTAVDVERHYKGKKPELNQSKVGPLILIDPVQPLRNAAAAVSLQTFSRFVAAARNFIKNPSQRFFEKRQITEAKLKEAAGKNRLIMLELGLKRAKLDVNGARIVKALEFVDSRLKENDFKVIDKGWEWDKSQKAMVWLVADSTKLDKTKIHAGPPADLKEHAAAFRKRYKNSYVKEGKLFAEVKRRFTEPEKLVGSLLGDEYLKEKFRDIKQIQKEQR